MVQSLESSNIISAQEMHLKVMTQKLFACDKDGKTGLSKAELDKFLSGSGEVPEFAKKLAEKFSEVDKNKDGQVSKEELGSLQNDRGIWSVAMSATPTASVLNAAQAASPVAASQGIFGAQSSGSSMDLLSKNIQSLVKKGMTIANNNPQLLSKLEGVVHKII